MPITNSEKYREAIRELAYRRNVYTRLVVAGRMNAEDADRRIAVMEAIAADYERLVEENPD